MNPNIDKLQPYPFEKLAKIKAGLNPPAHLEHIALSIGEPKHQPPSYVLDKLRGNIQEISKYPSTKGSTELRQEISKWLEKRFNLSSVNPETQVLPVNGTREALFAFTQAMVNSNENALVISPNPFYQIYEGAAYLSGAKPYFINCIAENGFIPDYETIPDTIWERCEILFLCTPGNPTGAITSIHTFKKLIELAQKHKFIIASDECYSEIYPDEDQPPPGLLEACEKAGNHEYKNCMVFHSLSKRSNLPGLRSGFVAGDAELIEAFLKYRTYHGCAMSIPNQLASIAAWADEMHVQQNRNYYREKFSRVYKRLKDYYDIELPQAGFYFWLKTPINDIEFSARLFEQQHITVLPGQYLSRTIDEVNPGEGYVRMAMVAEIEECEQAAQRMIEFAKSL